MDQVGDMFCHSPPQSYQAHQRARENRERERERERESEREPAPELALQCAPHANAGCCENDFHEAPITSLSSSQSSLATTQEHTKLKPTVLQSCFPNLVPHLFFPLGFPLNQPETWYPPKMTPPTHKRNMRAVSARQESTGTARERAIASVERIGPCTFNAVLSTLLAAACRIWSVSQSVAQARPLC